MAKFLINSGIKTDLVGISSWTPLHLAVFKNHIDIVKYLIDHGDANIDAKDDKGWNPLLMAVSNSDIELVKYLINCDVRFIDCNINSLSFKSNSICIQISK